MHVVLAPCVHAAAQERRFQYVANRNAQLFGARGLEIAVKSEPYITNLNPARSPEANAQCRLYPPHAPSMSSVSPTA